MSMVEEDVELRDLLAQTLEKNGCLSKLRVSYNILYVKVDLDQILNGFLGRAKGQHISSFG